MAYVLSSVSGNLISAASAGFAPTNSADVSAIASAYQVVSATATQLYAGTAYVTSVNDNPLSASRAGNAANASLATSAYYDGTGRLISALPDSATVSAIASSYAESAASSKQDTLTFGYNTADQISSIDGSALGGMDEAAVSAIASAYADSAASGKLDKTAQVVTSLGTGWNSDDGEIISSVNGCILSADEARYARAADGANYARYDRRPNVPGYRTISSLPGSAEVSAIASAYAESAVSSKADSSALSSYVPYSSLEYNTASAISGINGSALAAGSTYSAGEGIDITDDVISVEAPVDIVAGPGIVIDNPDGNTLRVSMAADYEVTLFETTSTDGYGVLSGTLSEAYTNFEYIEIYGNRTSYNWNGMNLPCHDRIYTLGSPTSFHLMSMLSEGGNANTFFPSEQFTLSSTAFAYKGGVNYQAGSSGMSVSVNNFNGIGVQRIVGIHRLANN